MSWRRRLKVGLTRRFRLLYVNAGGDGSEYLRASEQAINIFVEALDLDIEAAQIANEAQLSALIARGAVESAVQVARRSGVRAAEHRLLPPGCAHRSRITIGHMA